MGVKLLETPEAYRLKRQYGFFDDFDHLNDDDVYSTTATDSGTATVSDGVKGVLDLAPGLDVSW